MEKKKVIKLFVFLFVLVLIFLPGYSKFQELSAKNRAIEEKIKQLDISNKRLRKELVRMQEDPTYVEKVARSKLKVLKKGEIVYKVVETEQ